MKRKIFILLGLIIVTAIIIGLAMYFKPHDNMSRQTAEFSLSTDELLIDFEADEAVANEKYVDKVIEVTGEIGSVDATTDKITLILNTENPVSGVICEMDDLSDHNSSLFVEGEKISLKCLCTGYLMDVAMRRCVVVN